MLFFLRSSASVYYTECKPKNKKNGGSEAKTSGQWKYICGVHLASMKASS